MGDTAATTGGALVALIPFMMWKGSETMEMATEKIVDTTENLAEDFTHSLSNYSVFTNIYNFSRQAINILGKVPEIIMVVFQNIVIFFYVFCALIIIGRFDWLLDDIYTLTAISITITYLTYR